WAGGAAIDLDFYLLDADSNEVKISAGQNDPEVITVNNLAAGSYIWKVLAYTVTKVACIAIPTAVGESRGAAFALSQNTPNPFRATSAIHFTLPAAGHVRLEIFDVAGRLVRTLVDGDMRPGAYQRVWNGTTQAGTQAPSGIYFYRLR